jgi:hypothetical protein
MLQQVVNNPKKSHHILITAYVLRLETVKRSNQTGSRKQALPSSSIASTFNTLGRHLHRVMIDQTYAPSLL